jgi:hypothetical protein
MVTFGDEFPAVTGLQLDFRSQKVMAAGKLEQVKTIRLKLTDFMSLHLMDKIVG